MAPLQVVVAPLTFLSFVENSQKYSGGEISGYRYVYRQGVIITSTTVSIVSPGGGAAVGVLGTAGEVTADMAVEGVKPIARETRRALSLSPDQLVHEALYGGPSP